MASLYQTPEQYLTAMIAAIQASGSKLTDFNEGSVTRSLFEAQAVALSNQSLVLEQLRLDSYLATATGDALTLKALDYQVKRNPAVAATGLVRIQRPVPGSGPAITVPAGWGALVTVPAPGQPSVSYITLADATLPVGTDSVEVLGAAVAGGQDGNVSQAAGATLTVLPVNPISGLSTDGSFLLKGPWTGGVDEESDDALRERVPITVQGRVKGKEASLLAAALGIPGVTSAQVLKAGDTRADTTTVGGGEAEVYYKGAAGLLATVTAAVLDAAVLNQNVSAFTATAERIIAALTVYYLPGTDTVALDAAVRAAIQGAVNAGKVGTVVRYVNAIDAVHNVAGAETIAIPFAQFRLNSEAPGNAHDLVIPPGHYADLADADLTVTLTSL